MSQTRIVTDSTADLTPDTVADLGITVVPVRINLGAEVLTDEPSLRSVEFYKRMVKNRAVPQVVPPTARQFADVFTQLAKETDDIVCLHVSSHFSKTVQAANEGRASFLGRCHINVVDSQFISRALGILVTEAAKAALRGAKGADIVRLVRGLVARTYLVFHVETMDYMKRNGLVPQVRGSIVGMSSVKPLLMLEDGEISPLQRLRNRGKPTERLYEFVAEFTEIKQLAILCSGLNQEADIIEFKAQLGQIFPEEVIEEHIYGPAFGAYVGPTALGVVAYEGAGLP
jgi:DegV family protein with EDD domain